MSASPQKQTFGQSVACKKLLDVDDYEPTREAAMAAMATFAKSWRRE
jgi:hypothetical protein